jgi:hypothetical protein
MKYYATKKSNFRIHNRKDMETEIAALPDGRYTIEIKKYRKNKSHEQMGYLFGVVYPLFWKDLLNAGWEFESIEEVDLWCKSQWANRDILNRESGEILKVPALKRAFVTTDMMAFIQKIRDYDAEYLGGYIPEPLKQTEIDFKDE